MSANFSLWDKIQESVAPYPTQYGGLLGEGDVKSARNQGLISAGLSLLGDSQATVGGRNLGASLAQGFRAGQEGYQGAIQNKVGGALQKQAFDMNQQKMAAGQAQQNLMQARQQLIQQNPPPAAGDPQAQLAWIDSVVPKLAMSDPEGAQTLINLRKSIEGKMPQAVQIGDSAYTYTPGKGYNDGKGGFTDTITNPHAGELAQAKLEAASARADASQASAGSARTDRLVTNYDRNTKELFARAMPINQASMAITQARTDPTVGANAIVAFMSAVDPKAQQRYQMVNWISQHLTPAYAAAAERFLEGKTTGLLPKGLLDAMAAHVKRTRDITVSQATRARQEQEKIHPELAGQLRDISSEFEPDPQDTYTPRPGGPHGLPRGRTPGETPEAYLQRTGGR